MAITYASCQSTPEKLVDSVATAKDQRNIYTGDDGHTYGIDVKLNNGAKWEANSATTDEMGAMLGMTKGMLVNATLEDYRGLQKRLAVSYQKIIQKCTIKGEALNQLNAYMTPLKEKIDKLITLDLDASISLTHDIRDYLLKYSHFFFS
jgi:hypothetical protein